MTDKDAVFFYNLYNCPELMVNFDGSPFLKGEIQIEFTMRIMTLCEIIFTIRPAENPDLKIGECALHHWIKETAEISIGGSLVPEYWEKV